MPLELILGGDEEPSRPAHPPSGARPDPARLLRVRAGRVRAAELELVRALFVPPPGYSAARRLLTAGRLVVLYGPPGTGRRTAALHLLAEQGCSVVLAAEPAAARELTDSVLAPGHGYLVHGPAAPRIAADHLGTLTDRLARADARLVVLVDAPAPLPESVRRVHVVPIRPADPYRVLRRHLTWSLGPAAADEPSLRELTPPGTPPPRAAATAAALITLARRRATVPGREPPSDGRAAAPGADDSRPAPLGNSRHGAGPDGAARVDADMVRTLRADPDAELDRWFGEHDDPAEAAFLVACAAFEGFDFEDVATAADRLRPELRGDGDPPDDPLGRARRRLIEVAGVRLVPDVVPSRAGRHRVERVVFPPGRATAVLAFVWREYRELRPVLLDWLLDSCADAPPAVHARVGAVVGTLVGAATGQDVTATFDDWAADDRPWVRALAARALDAAGRDAIVGTQVRTRLAAWDVGDDPYLAEVAVRVYGGLFGRVRPSVAFDRLQRAARAPDRVPHVADSLVRLMEDDELRPSVLAMLARWYDDPDLTAATAHTVTRALGRTTGTTTPPSGPDPGPEAQPGPPGPGAPPDSHSSEVHRGGSSLDFQAVDERVARVAAARTRLAYWQRGGHQARSLLVQVLEGTRSHVDAMRALWDLCLLARADSALAGQVTALVTDLLRPPATEGLRWLADDLADRIGADPSDDFQRGLLRVVRGFRALDREGPVLYTAEQLPGQRLLGIRLGWDRRQALVLVGHDGRLTAEEPGRRGVRLLDVLTRRYAAAYRVELDDQPLTFPVDLADRSVDVRLTWRVSDPAQIVKRRMRDGAAYVHQVVDSRVRRLAADHDTDLQAALDAELSRPTELPEAGLAFKAGRAWVPDRPGPHR